MKLSQAARPFIGIAGVKTVAEAEMLQELARTVGLPEGWRLAVGVLASYRGLARNELADPNQYVLVEQLPHLMLRGRQLLNVVHYNSEADALPAQVHTLLKEVKFADAVQMNIVWPKSDQIERLRWETFAPIILQVGGKAFAEAGMTPAGVIERLKQYLHEPKSGAEPVSTIEYVLIDPSGGLGQPFDAGYAETMLTALVASGLPMRWGMAGGLGPDNVADKIGPLLDIYPKLFFDAQSSLRTADRASLDLGKCKAFVEAGVALLHSKRAKH